MAVPPLPREPWRCTHPPQPLCPLPIFLAFLFLASHHSRVFERLRIGMQPILKPLTDEFSSLLLLLLEGMTSTDIRFDGTKSVWQTCYASTYFCGIIYHHFIDTIGPRMILSYSLPSLEFSPLFVGIPALPTSTICLVSQQL